MSGNLFRSDARLRIIQAMAGSLNDPSLDFLEELHAQLQDWDRAVVRLIRKMKRK